jgi:hypothetical protein
MTATTPVLFVWILVPYLMLTTGLDVVKAGLVLSMASALAALTNLVVGRVLDKAEPVVFMALIGVIEGVAYITYMYGFLLGVIALIVAGAVIERVARGFYTVYAVYEYDAYPEEFRDKAFMLHNFLPFLAQVVSYPVLGLVYASMLTSIDAMILSLSVFSVASIALGLVALLWLPRIGKKEIKLEGLSIHIRVPRQFVIMVAAIVALGLGTEFSQPIILANLFMNITGNPLLGLALYETFAAIPLTLVSPLMLRVDKRHGVRLLAIGNTTKHERYLAWQYSIHKEDTRNSDAGHSWVCSLY